MHTGHRPAAISPLPFCGHFRPSPGTTDYETRRRVCRGPRRVSPARRRRLRGAALGHSGGGSFLILASLSEPSGESRMRAASLFPAAATSIWQRSRIGAAASYHTAEAAHGRRRRGRDQNGLLPVVEMGLTGAQVLKRPTVFCGLSRACLLLSAAVPVVEFSVTDPPVETARN